MVDKFQSLLFLIIVLTITSFISSGCNQNKIIEEEKFIKIYTDILLTQDTIPRSAQSNETMLRGILEKHKVTLEDYKTTIQYYNQDSERWEKFFREAIANLEKQKMSSAK